MICIDIMKTIFKKYVREKWETQNTVECFWSPLKRNRFDKCSEKINIYISESSKVTHFY